MLASHLKPGMVLRHDKNLYQVLSAQFQMGGGKMGGLEHVKLRSLNTGTVVERSFRPDEKIETVEVERRKLEYLYQDSDYFVFMNPETYEQVPIHSSQIGERGHFLKENMLVTGLFLDERPLNLQFPEFVDLRVLTAPPPRHDQETSTYKSVTLENGMEILTPQFIKQGDLVRVDVESGKYLERV